ncbi:F-actin-capping protein subunit beta [Suhomyces tanzawaensis NRRL Y-17324]|uniref:F-actin-capping protein subunit beta n=1 Tax=Suhomyces tanzawaensis NRRL Y-17324 TaxID=984487 RepID=A0A1E4SHJ6_9ASCO|nr:F-actin-capping protein subunit beta [Suhomyces tanzawaensis NRRL Y-17324]ODV78984.1 F-actin-capping protein subunit beta [Suhomyces tanzawaensis NRRL Y-17324]
MSYEDKFDASLSLLRRLHPKQITANLDNICTLIQQNNGEDELVQDLLSSVDTPLKVVKCQDTGKPFLCCDYNRDGDSYRSPCSNKYFPVQADDDELPPFPSNTIRQLEIKANDAFDVYRDLYYEGSGISSVYLWDTEDDETLDGFAGVVLIKKDTEDGSGKWNSIHVFEVIPESASTALYKLTTSVILDLKNNDDSSLSLAGSLTRQLETIQTLEVDGGSNLETSHLINLGTLVEKSEYNIRNLLQEVYFDKLKDIMLKDLRSVGDLGDQKLENLKQSELIKGLQGL